MGRYWLAYVWNGQKSTSRDRELMAKFESITPRSCKEDDGRTSLIMESKSVRSWARTHYKINFPVMQKLSFADRSLPPLWRQILDLSEYPSWNFWKYLIDRDGKFLDYYDNFAMEDVLEPAITAALRPREDL